MLKPEILQKLKESSLLRTKIAVARAVHPKTMDYWVSDTVRCIEEGTLPRHAEKLTASSILKCLAAELGYANPMDLVEAIPAPEPSTFDATTLITGQANHPAA